MWLTRFAISRPVITAMVFIALAIFGTISFYKIGRSNNPPGTDFPIVVVYAAYPGASPQEMERLIVKPIEDQLDSIDNLDQLSATAQEGVATVIVQFKLGTNLDLAAINVQSGVDTARVYLPADLDPPSVEKNGASQPLLDVAVSSKTLSQTQLADFVNNRLQPLLKGIPNVQAVNVYGAAEREFHVEPIPTRLVGANATLVDVFSAVAANNANLPGGILRQRNARHQRFGPRRDQHRPGPARTFRWSCRAAPTRTCESATWRTRSTATSNRRRSRITTANRESTSSSTGTSTPMKSRRPRSRARRLRRSRRSSPS